MHSSKMHKNKPMKRIIFYHIIFLLFIISGCQDKSGKLPENILSETEMVDILTDAYIAEASMPLLKKKGYDTYQATPKIYEHILKKHHTSKSIFDKSYTYYDSDFEKMKQIIEKVITNLNKIQRNLEVEKNDIH